MNEFNVLVQNCVNSAEPNYTPAEIPIVNNLKDHFTNAIQSGLNPVEVVKMVSIISLLLQKGINVDDLQNHNQLLVSLCINSEFSIMDNNINHIFNQMILARNS